MTASILLIVGVVGCAEPDAALPVTPIEPPTSAPATHPTTVGPTTAVPRDLLARLLVDDSAVDRAGYHRDLFPTWIDADGNGCDARVDTLVSESLTPAQVDRAGSCAVLGGDWLSVYDGQRTDDPSELDVDHLVPLAEAWRSGAYRWEALHRLAYANDTNDPETLIAVSASTNRSKGDDTPDRWRPPRRESWCWYASAWIGVKVRWELTITTSEREALGQMAETC